MTESSPAGTSQDSTALSIEESGFLTGVIETQRLPTFERMIWRVSHGYALLKYLDMDNTIVGTHFFLHKLNLIILFLISDRK